MNFLEQEKELYLPLKVIPSLNGAGIPGGPSEVPVDSPDIVRLSNFVLKKLNEESGGNKTIVEVSRATVQVVAGTLTRLTLKLSDGGEEKICEISIWEKPWLNFIEITDVECDDQIKKRSKREDLSRPRRLTEVDDHRIILFHKFLRKYNKIYPNETEYERRYHIYRANLQKIKLLRETEQGSGKYGITWFTDLSSEEFKHFLGLKRPTVIEKLPEARIPKILLPDEFDWRHYNVVTPVKNQGFCGSCWAFSVTGNIESQWALKNGELLSLSEQELIDCDTLDTGCSGGFMTDAYKAIMDIGGLEVEQDYPYKAKDDNCHFLKAEAKVKISGSVNITKNENDMAKWLVKNGPISVALNANAMQFYIGGVSHPLKFLCDPDDLNHGVLIVGFGVKHSKFLKKTLPYWVVKNSWGKSWGEKGYYRIFRGDGTCGINQMASSAII